MICVMRPWESRTKGTFKPLELVMPFGVIVSVLLFRSWIDWSVPSDASV